MLSYVAQFEFHTGLPLASARVAFVSPVLYLLLIAVLVRLGLRAPPELLRSVSIVHNTVLSYGSLAMAVGIAAGVALDVKESGSALTLLCSQHGPRGVLGFTLYVYYLSKFVEWIDTLIIVLKGKRPIPLHLWHHAIIVPLTWSWLWGAWHLVWLGAFMNCCIHFAMYNYYLQSILHPGYTPWYKKYLTGAQILQFAIVFMTINVFLFFFMQSYPTLEWNGWVPRVQLPQQGCAGSFGVVLASQFVNITFLTLFSSFYINSYVRGDKRRKRE